MQFVNDANKIKIDNVIKNLEKRGFQGHYCETKEDACEKVLSMIPDGSVICWGGSETINQIGAKGKLKERNVKVIDPYATQDPAESTELKRQGMLSDYFLMSTNALTMDGELLNIDGTSNRVASLCFGPKNVIIVAGVNKLARKLEDAYERAKLNAALANNIRVKKNNPCTVTGVCNNCISKTTICCNIVTTRYCGIPGRIHVILVNENLGF